jgi:hypothetical protein
VDLDRTLDDVVIDLGHLHLAHRDMRARSAVRLTARFNFVYHPCCLQDEQTILFKLDDRFGNWPLNHLVLGEQLALRAPRHRALQHHLDSALAFADGAHGVMDPSAAEPSLCHLEAVARIAEHGVEWHANLVVAYIAVGAVILAV